MKDFMADINRIKQRHRLSKEVEVTDCGSELNDMIVKTRNFTQGPWYKCIKGKVFPSLVAHNCGSLLIPDYVA